MSRSFIGLAEARELVRRRAPLLPGRPTPLAGLVGRVAAAPILSRADSPSVTAATKDGFAVMGGELATAGPDRPVRLKLAGAVAAGESYAGRLEPGQAVRVNTGAPLPPGADAVLAQEFVREEPDAVICLGTAPPGINLLRRGSDVEQGEELAVAGQIFTPALVGLLAAGGQDNAPAHPLPRVGLLATGREVVAPGEPLPKGAVYASNLVAAAAWFSLHGMESRSRVVDDDAGQIADAAMELLADSDALITSGGAWTSGRDLVLGALQGVGLELVFWRVRMGPGKGVGFGLLEGKPVFCLPGGPPSNEMALLQLALPGLLGMAGFPDPGLPERPAILGRELTGQADWTQFWHGRLDSGEGLPVFTPSPLRGRLKSMANSHGIVCLEEGRERVASGEVVRVQVLGPAWDRGRAV